MTRGPPVPKGNQAACPDARAERDGRQAGAEDGNARPFAAVASARTGRPRQKGHPAGRRAGSSLNRAGSGGGAHDQMRWRAPPHGAGESPPGPAWGRCSTSGRLDHLADTVRGNRPVRVDQQLDLLKDVVESASGARRPSNSIVFGKLAAALEREEDAVGLGVLAAISIRQSFSALGLCAMAWVLRLTTVHPYARKVTERLGTGRPREACAGSPAPLSGVPRGWRGQAPRQPGQVRKEAAVTSPAWVVVQPLTFSVLFGPMRRRRSGASLSVSARRR